MLTNEDISKTTGPCVHFVDAAPHLKGTEISANPTSDAELFAAFAKALNFDAEFGDNWDALTDSLRDAKVEAIVLRHATELWRAIPRSMGTLVEIWQQVAAERNEAGEPFHLVFVW